MSPKTIRREIERGNIGAHKLGSRWRIPEKDYAAWIERARYIPVEKEPADWIPVVPARGSVAALRRIEGEAA